MLSTPTQAIACSKYYEYKLKARPAELYIYKWNIGRFLGDHTYVCIKKKRKKSGKLKTVRNYGCHNQFGGNTGGSTRQRMLVKKTSYTEHRKDSAQKIHYADACKMVYGWHGLCHQDSSRMLYSVAGDSWDPLSSRVFGYNWRAYRGGVRSLPAFGRFGFGWVRCLTATYNSI